MLFKTLKIPLDSLFNIGLGLSTSIALRNAAGKGRAVSHKDPVLILLNYHSKFHKDLSFFPAKWYLEGYLPILYSFQTVFS